MLRVLVDRSAVEAYSAGGRGVATHRGAWCVSNGPWPLLWPPREDPSQRPMTPMHCALVHPSAGQRAVKLINTGTVDVKIEATAYPMAEATRPSAAELLATGPGPPGAVKRP